MNNDRFNIRTIRLSLTSRSSVIIKLTRKLNRFPSKPIIKVAQIRPDENRNTTRRIYQIKTAGKSRKFEEILSKKANKYATNDAVD